jgi:SH3-like domain-containing protein
MMLVVSCVPAMDPAIDEATILRDNTSVRIDGNSSSRTMFMLNAGDRVSIIEKQGTWYRVRDQELIEGWMEESTLLRDSTRQVLAARVAGARDQPVQNTARATNQVNLRLEPGRQTTLIRRLRRGTALEVLERATTPRPNSDSTDIWYKVRPSADEVGWVYYQLMEYDIPEAIRPFTEGRTYMAVRRLKRVEDPEEGPIDWYVVAERRRETAPELDFDGIRVFIWNLEERQYETTLRLRNLQGSYPVELTGDENQPGFRIHVLGRDGEPTTREFVMRGTLPREIR